MTERQKRILESIVRIYAESAEPVGSLQLVEEFDCSPATIRAEMAALERQGLIYQPHISAGRVPTDKGYRFFVNSQDRVSPKQRTIATIEKRVSSMGTQADGAVKMAAETLSDLTGNMAFATLSDSVYFHGISQLFSQPEFADSVQATLAARFLDAMQNWLFDNPFEESLQVYIGSENPIVRSSGLSTIISRYSSPWSTNNYIGVVGPTRQSYGKVISLVELAGNTLEEILNG